MWLSVALLVGGVGVGMAAGERIARLPWPWYAWRFYYGIVILVAFLWIILPSYNSAGL